jgi:KDO2-lipid IV(A) lauroyltransferase
MNESKTRTLVNLLKWFGRMRPSTRLRIGAALGWLAMRLAKSRTRIVRRNLELCFPDQPEEVRERWVREHFRALAQSIVDRGVLWYGTPEAIKDMVTQSGAERINDLTAQGRSVILLAPHFIGLDAAATRLTMEVPSAATMYTPQSDPHIDAVVAAGRARFNEVFLVSRKDGVRELIRHLRAPRPVYYLPDMDFGRQGAVFAPFFGVQAATLLATAQLAKKWDAAVLPILDFWNPETGRYHAEVLPPLENFPGDDSLEEATARLNRELEAWVRRCPSQYYWVHRRFKTRPPGEAKLY